jgi:hypothetical protein
MRLTIASDPGATPITTMAFVAQYLVTATSLGQQVEAWLLSPWEREERGIDD